MALQRERIRVRTAREGTYLHEGGLNRVKRRFAHVSYVQRTAVFSLLEAIFFVAFEVDRCDLFLTTVKSQICVHAAAAASSSYSSSPSTSFLCL